MKRVWIETYGCQMNVADSELMIGVLGRDGYVVADTPEGADVMLVNTCAVRDNAEQRVIGRVGELQRHKHPGVILGVVGETRLVERRQEVDVGVPGGGRLLEAGGVLAEVVDRHGHAGADQVAGRAQHVGLGLAGHEAGDEVAERGQRGDQAAYVRLLGHGEESGAEHGDLLKSGLRPNVRRGSATDLSTDATHLGLIQ